MILLLIRHGRTRANECRQYCGASDLPVTEDGLEALKKLASGYHAPEHCRFLTSGMLRTEQTLQALFGAVKHEQCPALREPDFGIFELHSYEELKDRPEYQQWITGDFMANVPPEGESGVQMAQRVCAAMEKILLTDENTVIVTHGGVIAEIMGQMFPQENKNRFEWQPKPGCGYCIDTAAGSWQAVPEGAE